MTSDVATVQITELRMLLAALKPVTETSGLETSVWRSCLNVVFKVCYGLPANITSPFQTRFGH